jgi:hypothetical protein
MIIIVAKVFELEIFLCVYNICHVKGEFILILVPTLHSANYLCTVGFEVRTVMTVKSMVWDVLQCSSVNVPLANCFLLAL